MAKKKHDRGPGGTPAGPSGPGPTGQGLDPSALPEEAALGGPEPGAVPLGLPISPEELEELQRQARHKKPPPPGCAQEDPSAAPDGG
jgi:hypothetical protein